MDTMPPLDAALLDRVSRQCAELSERFDRFGADLYALSVTVATAQPSPRRPVPAQGPAPDHLVPVGEHTAWTLPRAEGPAPSDALRPSAGVGAPAQGASPASSAPRAGAVPSGPESPAYRIPRPVQEPAEPWWQRDGWVSRILALAGVAVTLAGIVMLLVLAARAGLLRPEIRVAGGVLMAGAFFAAAQGVIGRPGGRVGGVALAATGVVASYLDVLAVTVLYDWVSAPVGLVLALAVALSGGALAMRWRSQPLAVIVAVACALTAPVLTNSLTLTLVLFLVAVQVAGALPELMRGWSVLAAARTAPAVIALVPLLPVQPHPGARAVALAVVVAVVGLVVGLWGAPVQRRPEVAALSAGLASVPLLYAVVRSERPLALLLSLGLAAACLGAVTVLRRRPAPIRTVVTAVGGVALLLACVAVAPSDAALRSAPLLVVAIVAGALSLRVTSRFVQVFAGVFGVLGLLTALDSVGVTALVSEPVAAQVLGAGSLVTGVLLLAATVLVGLGARRAGLAASFGPGVLVGVVAVGLYAATIVCVSLPLALGFGGSGFHAGHFAATTVWMLIGCGLLALGLAHPSVARVCLAAGLTVVGASLAKLIAYDMAALDGFTRAATFLVTGVLLLVAGTRYARAFADQTRPGVHP